MPVARITRSADSVRPSESSTAFVPSGCWRISRTVTPQWIGTFRVASQRRAWSAAGASSIRGSSCPSRSTTANCQFRLYIAFSTMKPMNPAPTSTTRGVRPAPCSDSACFSARSVWASDQRGCDPRQIGAADRRLDRRRSGGDQQGVEFEPAAVTQRYGLALRIDRHDADAEAGRDLQPRKVSRVAGMRMRFGDLARQPVGQRHAGMGGLVADQCDGRPAAIEFPDRFDGVGRRRSTADDDVVHGLGVPNVVCGRGCS